jgi:hypothetical protein
MASNKMPAVAQLRTTTGAGGNRTGACPVTLPGIGAHATMG